LPTVRKITYPNKEIIVVNNGSTDDSWKFLRDEYPEIKVLEIKVNCGYAGANNRGVKMAKGKYILLLNNDTKVTPNFLQVLVEDMENNPQLGAVQPQIRSLIKTNLLDSVVSYQTFSGFLYHFGYMKPFKNKKYKHQLYAFSIKGACFLIKRIDYLKLGGLDEDFVCYVEETDLCHRIWLSGKKIIYEPDSVVYHWGGGDMQVMTKDEVTMYRSYRNRFISLIKNSSVLELLKTLPFLFLFCEAFIAMTFIKGSFKRALGAQLGILSIFFILPSVLSKRRFIQTKIRKVSDYDISKFTVKNPRLSYYYHFFANPGGYKD
jgi:GT2 family glycosyltransferase